MLAHTHTHSLLLTHLWGHSFTLTHAHVHSHTHGFKCWGPFIVIVFTKVWRVAERLSESKHGGYNEYVGVHYGRKSTQEERCFQRSTGVCIFCVNAANLLQGVVVGEIVFLHFLYENTAKSQLSILSSFSEALLFVGYKHWTCCQVPCLLICAALCFVMLQFESPKQLDYPCLPCVSPAHALPMFREARQRSTRKQLEKDRLDPKKSHKPEPPVSGPGKVLFSFSCFY